MPPFVGRKRRRSPTPVPSPSPSRRKPAPRRKEEAGGKTKSSPSKGTHTARSSKLSVTDKPPVDQQHDSGTSSSSSSDDEEFEDVLPTKKQKRAHDDSDEEIDWEDALPRPGAAFPADASAPSGDLELTLSKGDTFAASSLTDNTKKGPTKIERYIRIATHCMHVQLLLFHHLIRNGWACDQKAQKILVDQLPGNLKDRVQKWRVASGLVTAETEATSKKNQSARKGKRAENTRQQRDWGNHAVRQELGVPDMSRGDPLPRLLKELVAYWKRAFSVSAPALRKQGYKPMNLLQEEIASYNNDQHDPGKHGERVRSRSEFRRCAKSLEGSRDIGSQLFVCLLRGLGIETRLVASLQPVGFAWSKAEEAATKKKQQAVAPDELISFDTDEEDSSSAESETQKKTTQSLRSALEDTPKNGSQPSTKNTSPNSSNKRSRPSTKQKLIRQQPARGSKDAPIDLDRDGHISVDSESSSLSDAQSVSSIASNKPKNPTSQQRKPGIPFDRDMVFPNCWVEAISPLTNKVIPIDPVVSFTVATDEEQLAAFEPRGKKADKSKQVLAYVVAYNADGTAKDVTTRYLKRRQWPGKTKGLRLPAENVPVYNRAGKVARYEKYDWFKRVMSGYTRSAAHKTDADELEDLTDLQPLQISKNTTQKPVEEIETLAGYKQSTDFVLKRHLRRDEALLPDAEPVRYFTPTNKTSKKASTGGSSASKQATDPEPVYKRTDVVSVKTAESWHKEGRAVLSGVQPLKTAPIRAVTLARKREVEEATRANGVAPTQGLYSKEQTDWIVPEPIRDGKIPRNSYGNIDVFVPRMVPEGAVHVPYRGANKACKKLGCDFAEAVVGFEFGNRLAVPITRGVVVAIEWEEALVEEIQRDEEAKRIKEEGKRTAAAMAMWRKFIMGLRIAERIRAEYGPDEDGSAERNPFLNRKSNITDGSEVSVSTPGRGKKKATCSRGAAKHKKESVEDTGGGFIAEQDDMSGEAGGSEGGFVIEDPTDISGEVEDDAMDEGDEEHEADSEADNELEIE